MEPGLSEDDYWARVAAYQNAANPAPAPAAPQRDMSEATRARILEDGIDEETFWQRASAAGYVNMANGWTPTSGRA
jgi:hypothetical protein